ncbi:MAG: DUF1365 domain-containing protein [Dokdonella sp.]
MTASELNSAIYEGWLRHRRYMPKPHAFQYRLCVVYLDLAEIDRVFAKRWLWSVNRRNLGEFRRRDYLGDPERDLAECVRDRVEAQTGARPTGPVRMLAHLRYLGHCFNPVVFYYCYADDGKTLQYIVAEITNTPWKERHAYVLPISEATDHGSIHQWGFDKAFHVSPFMAMQQRYDWRLSDPGEALRIHMDVLDPDSTPATDGENPLRRRFDSTMVLQRHAIDGTGLARVLWRYPLMTLQVVFAIHWQALRLWLRGNPVHDHPDNKVKTA